MAGLYSEKQQIDVNAEFNINMPAEERRARIADLLSKKQGDAAIPVDYEVVKSEDEEK